MCLPQLESEQIYRDRKCSGLRLPPQSNFICRNTSDRELAFTRHYASGSQSGMLSKQRLTSWKAAPTPSKLQNYLVRINKMTPSNIAKAIIPTARRIRCCLGCLSDNKTSSWAETKLNSAFL